MSRGRRHLNYHRPQKERLYRLKWFQMNDQPTIHLFVVHRPSILVKCSSISSNLHWLEVNRILASNVACAKKFLPWTQRNCCSIGMHFSNIIQSIEQTLFLYFIAIIIFQQFFAALIVKLKTRNRYLNRMTTIQIAKC